MDERRGAEVFKELAREVNEAVKEVRRNLGEFLAEWKAFQEEGSDGEVDSSQNSQFGIGSSFCSKEYVIVRKDDLERLSTEIMQLKEFLPKVLDGEVMSALPKLVKKEEELYCTSRDMEQLTTGYKLLEERVDTVMTDCEKEREEKFNLQYKVSALMDQLCQQSDFCSSMGSACCTLLWRVSRQEEVIPAILGGSSVGDYLHLVGNTLDSFIATYKEGAPPPTHEEASNELQFVLAICGTITNIAASAFGRDFLCTNSDGQTVIEVFINAVKELPLKHPSFTRIRNLLLMSLYNISINHQGIKYLNAKGNLLHTMGWLLEEEEDNQLKLNSLKLLQSLILEPDNPSVAHRALEVIPMSLLRMCSQDRNMEIRQIAMEIMNDLNVLKGH